MGLFLPFPPVSGDMTLSWPLAPVWVKDYKEEKTLVQPCLKKRSNVGG